VVCLFLSCVYGLSRQYPNTTTFNSQYTIFWAIEGDEIALALQVHTIGWVGFGIAEPTSGSMRGGDIVTASVVDGVATVVDRHATQHALPDVDDCQSWVLVAGSEDDVQGITTIEMRRKLDTQDTQDRPILPGYTKVLWAFGENDTVAYHGLNKSPSTVRFYGDDITVEIADPGVQTIDLLNDNYVVPNATTFWSCKTFQLPFSEDVTVVAAEPIVSPGSLGFLHHYAIVWCGQNDSFVQSHYQTNNCFGPFGKIASSCETALFGWGPNPVGETIYFPQIAGLKMGPNSIQFLEVQIHFNNPTSVNNIVDNSGVRLYYTSTPRQYDIGVLTLGDPTLAALPIPPGQNAWDLQSECLSDCTQRKFPPNITIFGGYNHAHTLAISMFTSLYRASGQFLGYASRAEFYDFNFQHFEFEDVPFVLYPGDRLVTHCVYDSTTKNTPTTFGIATTNEMCTAMLFYYPQIEEMSFCGFTRLNKTAPASMNATYCGLRQASDVIQISNPVNPDPISTITPMFGLQPSGPCQATPVVSTTSSSTTGSTGKSSAGVAVVANLMFVLLSVLIVVNL